MISLQDLPPLLYYYQEHKDANLAKAIVYGFGITNWRPVGDAKCYPGEWIHVINSLQYGAFQILRQCMEEGKKYIFIDNGYVNNHLTANWINRAYRIVPNAFQHNWQPHIFDVARYENLYGKPLASICGHWKYGYGDHILIIPQSSWESNKLYNLERWLFKTYNYIHDLGYRGEIRIRQKGHYQRPLEQDLMHATACVCFTSNVAIDAIRLGIPTYCSEYSAAAPMKLDLLTELKHLADITYFQNAVAIEPQNRLEWLQALTCGQFTHTEISNGFAKEVVMQEMIRRLNSNE